MCSLGKPRFEPRPLSQRLGLCKWKVGLPASEGEESLVHRADIREPLPEAGLAAELFTSVHSSFPAAALEGRHPSSSILQTRTLRLPGPRAHRGPRARMDRAPRLAHLAGVQKLGVVCCSSSACS